MSIPDAQAVSLDTLITPTPDAVASRVLAKAPGGTITLFAFDAGQALSEHTSPFDALVHVLSGRFALTVAGRAVDAHAGTLVRLPAHVPHALDAREPSRMLLMMLK